MTREALPLHYYCPLGFLMQGGDAAEGGKQEGFRFSTVPAERLSLLRYPETAKTLAADP